MLRYVCCAVLCLTAGILTGPAWAQTTALDQLKGTWVIDVDRTLEFAQQSPKYTPEEGERLPAQLKMLRGLLKMHITGRQVITVRGDREQVVDFTPQTVTEDQAVLKVQSHGQEVTLTFTLKEGGVMHMKSSGTDDMDYFLWRKSRPPIAAGP